MKLARRLLIICLVFYCVAVHAETNVSVQVKGLEGEQLENVRLFLSMEQQQNHPLMSEGRLHKLHAKAPAEIAKGLQPYGFYQPKIETELKRIAPDQWLAIYTVDKGPALPIGEFDVKIEGEMAGDLELKTLLQNAPLALDKPFNHLQYEALKSSLAKLASERGYFDARFETHRVEIDLKKYEARIHLHYNGGARYAFGEVILSQEVLDEDLLQRYIPFEMDSPYTLNDLIDLQQALVDSDYFEFVEVGPGEPQQEVLSVPVNVVLTPRKRHRYTLGLGYGTDTGVRTKFGWDILRLNTKGHRISSEIKISEIGYSLTTNYRVPILNPRTDQMVYSAGLVNEKTDTNESTIETIGASLNHSRGFWRESLSLNFQREEYIVADERGVSTLLMPGVRWSRTWGGSIFFLLDGLLDGLRFDIGVRGANKVVISDTDFVQLNGGAKAIHPLFLPRTRLITRGRLGGTWTDEFHSLPSSVRFFAGGSQSVRGFAYESLGPKDDKGQVVGGNHLVIGSVELEHRIVGNWGVALFYDVGNAIDFINDELERGAGIGLRWQSPVGPIRFDLASAVSRDGRPWRFHINIGPDL